MKTTRMKTIRRITLAAAAVGAALATQAGTAVPAAADLIDLKCPRSLNVDCAVGANLNVDNPFQPKASVETEASLGSTYTFTYDLTISTDLPARP